MPALKLVQASSLDESIQRARTLNDEYGFRRRLRGFTEAQLIAAFNREVGSRAWVSARAAYLVALRDALLATGLDCSGFIAEDGMAMDRKVRREADAIVPITR